MTETNDNASDLQEGGDTARRGGAPRSARPDPFSDGYELPTDGNAVVKEFDLGGAVPRQQPRGDAYRTEDVYIRLENTIYGPLQRDELTELLTSGQFTGYESASTDLQHWTPLLYHPRMNLTGQADPDRTHALLHQQTTLPQISQSPSRIRLEDLTDEELDNLEPQPQAMPLAAILIKKKRLRPGGELEDIEDADLLRERPKVVRTTLATTPERDDEDDYIELDLPIFGNLDEESVDDMIERHLRAEPPPIPVGSRARMASAETPPPTPRPASPPPVDGEPEGDAPPRQGSRKRTELLTPVSALDIFSDTVKGLTDEHDTVAPDDDVVEEYAFADAHAVEATVDALSEPDMIFAPTIDAPTVDEADDLSQKQRPIALLAVLGVLVIIALAMGAFIVFGGRG